MAKNINYECFKKSLKQWSMLILKSLKSHLWFANALRDLLKFSPHVSLIESCKLTVKHWTPSFIMYHIIWREITIHCDPYGTRRLHRKSGKWQTVTWAGTLWGPAGGRERALGSHICLSDLWKFCVNERTDWWKIHLLPVSLCWKSMLKATLLALQQDHLPHSPWWILFGAWGWEPWVLAVYGDRSEGGWVEEEMDRQVLQIISHQIL